MRLEARSEFGNAANRPARGVTRMTRKYSASLVAGDWERAHV
jgi:hypothetical protein